VTSVIDGLKELYVAKLKPLEGAHKFHDFVSPELVSSAGRQAGGGRGRQFLPTGQTSPCPQAGAAPGAYARYTRQR